MDRNYQVECSFVEFGGPAADESSRSTGIMICPGIAVDCDNPGCRHGGCQGRPPQPLRVTAAKLQVISQTTVTQSPALGLPAVAVQSASSIPELV